LPFTPGIPGRRDDGQMGDGKASRSRLVPCGAPKRRSAKNGKEKR
jgi:hypothetical protein